MRRSASGNERSKITFSLRDDISGTGSRIEIIQKAFWRVRFPVSNDPSFVDKKLLSSELWRFKFSVILIRSKPSFQASFVMDIFILEKFMLVTISLVVRWRSQNWFRVFNSEKKVWKHILDRQIFYKLLYFRLTRLVNRAHRWYKKVRSNDKQATSRGPIRSKLRDKSRRRSLIRR